MFCKNCGAQISDNAKFCGKCGASQGGNAERVTEKTYRIPTIDIFENKYILGIIGIGVLCLLIFICVKINQADNVLQCEQQIEQMIEQQDQDLKDSMVFAIKETFSEEDLSGVQDYINLCAGEWTEALLSGRSEIAYDVSKKSGNEIEIKATVENADLEESAEDFVAEAISTALTLDRKTMIEGVVKGLFDLSETDWQNHPEEIIKLLNESVCDALKNSINSASRESATGTFIFEKSNGKWVLTRGEDLDEFWRVAYGGDYEYGDYDYSYDNDDYNYEDYDEGFE